MDVMQQHLLDSYRAAQRGEAAPPAPGAAAVRTAREIRLWRRFQAVVTDPAERWWGRNGRLMRHVTALLARPSHSLNARGPAPTWRPGPVPTPPGPVPNSPEPVPNSPDLVPNSRDVASNSLDLVPNSHDLVSNSPDLVLRPRAVRACTVQEADAQ